MADNLIQIKRTSVSGRAANTTTLPNPGELALNMADGILYSGNGSVVFEIGANNTNVNVSGNLTVKSIIANGAIGVSGTVLTSNGSAVYWSTGATGYTGSQGDQGTTGFTGSQGTTGFTGSKGDLGFTGSIGFTGSQGSTGYDGSQGTTGFTGSQGTTGFTGSQGDVGYAGSQGSQGNSGFTGSQGGTGYTGSQGDTGYTGSKGDIGYTGSQGNQGTTGFTGSEGLQGTTGFVGSQGGTGFSGSQGDVGFTGSVGSIGYTGSQGDQGTTGFTGSKGDTGFTGSQGPQGTFGGAAFDYTFNANTDNSDPGNGQLKFSNTNISLANTLYISENDDSFKSVYNFLQTIDDSTSSIKGHFSLSEKSNTTQYSMFSIIGNHTHNTNYFAVPVSFLNGANTFSNGADVIITFARTGDIGDTGFTGSRGDTGYAGSQGNVGFTGSEGIQGTTGYTGSKGDQGTTGFTGSQGGTGFTGSQGDTGYTGSKGELGYTGSQGDQGITGFTGSRGLQGTEGFTGSQGGTGFTGSQGDVGYTGSQGTLGYTGSKGDQGTTGFTGSSGPIGGANSQILFNDSGSANGSTGLTFNNSTNELSVNGNILLTGSRFISVGNSTVNAVINTTSFSGTANNSLYLEGLAANQYVNILNTSSYELIGNYKIANVQIANTTLINYDNSISTFATELTSTKSVTLPTTALYSDPGFSIDFYFKPGSAFATGAPTSLRSAGTNQLGIAANTTRIEVFNAGYVNVGIASLSTPLVIGNWHHIAYYGIANTTYIAVDGVVYPLNNPGGHSAYTPTGVWSGGFPSIGATQTFEVSNFRLVSNNSNTFANSGTFTPPQVPFTNTAISNTYLLTLQSSTFIDNSGSNRSVTTTGSPTMVAVELQHNSFPYVPVTYGTIVQGVVNAVSFNTTGWGTSNSGFLANATNIVVGNSSLSSSINSTSFSGTSNNSLRLGGTLAASFVQNTDSRTLSGNLTFSGANTRFTGNLTITATGELIITSGAGIYANGTLGTDGQVLATNGTSVYWSTSSGSVGFVGSAGFTGSSGFTGSAGSNGFTGSKGDTGFTGSAGFTGSTGSQGNLGFTGSIGFTGSSGNIGFTGSQGDSGYTGSIGFTGSTGATGFTGSVGNTGFTGSVGSIGFTGSSGSTGSAGDTGFTGSIGNTGFTGSVGFTGSSGASGDTGFTGSKGDIGYTGSLGYTGSAGAGFTGSQGIIGYTGSAGTGGGGGFSNGQSIEVNNLVITGSLTANSSTGGGGQVLTSNGAGVYWSTVSGGPGGSSVTTSATAPVSPAAGDLWWNTENGTLYIYYNDGNTSQWVASIPSPTVGAGSRAIAFSILFGG